MGIGNEFAWMQIAWRAFHYCTKLVVSMLNKTLASIAYSNGGIRETDQIQISFNQKISTHDFYEAQRVANDLYIVVFTGIRQKMALTCMHHPVLSSPNSKQSECWCCWADIFVVAPTKKAIAPFFYSCILLWMLRQNENAA